MRIALIHALKHSIAPTEAAFARLWPEAVLANLLDDSLSADLARAGALTPAMTERFLTLARYAARSGANGILFTCSAFGPCIEACAADLAPLPVLKPNEAMIEEAVALAGPTARIGLIATFAPTLASMPAEFAAAAPDATLVPSLAAEALTALDRGDGQGHDEAAARAATALKDVDIIALAQFSLARAAPMIAAQTGKPVLTTPDSAVRKLQRALMQTSTTMDLAAFRASTAQPEPPPGLSLALQTLWWDSKGDWQKAHECAQADEGPTGSIVHAYLHRKEHDPPNARYWYNRAGRAPATGTLEQEWTALAQELLAA
jgi:aspartate/glutamate racemase